MGSGRCDLMFSSQRIIKSNLELLGFTSEDKDVSLSKDMFEHSNLKTFHQVMYFLLNCLDKEKGKSEFRDCWPSLDKKQEAEFRKKVANWVKELQRESGETLPFVNPALFQTPGGRKFIQFLRVFSSFVLSELLNKDESDSHLLPKPVLSKQQPRNVRKLVFNHLVELQKENLTQGVDYQMRLGDRVAKDTAHGSSISAKYFNMKSRREEILNDFKERREKIAEHHKGPEKDYREHLDCYQALYQQFQNKLETFQTMLTKTTELAQSINELTGVGVERPSLDLTSINKQLVDDANLLLTYENLLCRGKAALAKCFKFPTRGTWAKFPRQDMLTHLGSLEVQTGSMVEMKLVLEQLNNELTSSVSQLSAQADQVDWNSCLGDVSKSVKACDNLLPPSPAVNLQNYLNTPEIVSKLKLLTPSAKNQQKVGSRTNHLLQVPTGSAHVHGSPLAVQGGQTPRRGIGAEPAKSAGITPTGRPAGGPIISRKLSRKPTPDHSPLLKVSLLQSTIRANPVAEDSCLSQADSKDFASKTSLDCFSPGLSSTRAYKPEERDVRMAIPAPRMSDIFTTAAMVDDNRRLSSVPFLNIDTDVIKSDVDVPVGMVDVESEVNSDVIDKSDVRSLSNVRHSMTSTEMRAVTPDLAVDTTQSKIELYRKVLERANSKIPRRVETTCPSPFNSPQRKGSSAQEEKEEDGSSNVLDLLGVWTEAKNHISPRVSPRTSPVDRRRSSLLGLRLSLGGNQLIEGGNQLIEGGNQLIEGGNQLIDQSEGLQDLLTKQATDLVSTRLDALMDSLTLSDNSSLDITFGRMSFDEDMLLSPHC